MPDAPNPKLMTQKHISMEYGIPTRDILQWARLSKTFPKPVQVLGAKHWFRRSEIARYFKDYREPGDPRPSDPSAS
jgi:hypothetical protein